jgi:hypothetical protein
MRLIKTFVLRLYVDSDAPERICGDLQPLPKPKTFPFMNEDGLSILLRQLANVEKLDGQQPDRLDGTPKQEV